MVVVIYIIHINTYTNIQLYKRKIFFSTEMRRTVRYVLLARVCVCSVGCINDMPR